MTSAKQEAYPLTWPSGWQRTRPQDRKPMSSWKGTAVKYRDALAVELDRMKSPFSVISSNVPVNARGGLERGIEPLDVGVAVYFSRQMKEDFSWQDALNIHDPAPTTEQINEAYRKLAALHHPDKGGDLEMFRAVTRHRDNAMRWVTRKTDARFDYVIACDLFKEVRLNMAAIVMSIKAIRQLERCGTSSMLERAFKGFEALPEQAGPSGGQ